jgi:2-succinyl-6-hydroxy-2,4-cyclohexadiene-1-carboxylate synthase
VKDLRVATNGVAMQVRDTGRDGDAVVFLHFSGANLMMWQAALPFFTDRYRVVLVDLRGHGRSDAPESGYHMAEMARDVVGIMERLGIGRAHVVGSSLGAEVGLAMAADHPGRVISLVCDGALYSEHGPYGVWEGSEPEYQEHVARRLERMRNSPEAFFPSIDALAESSRMALEGTGWWNGHVDAMERYGAREAGDGRFASGFRKQAKLGYMEQYFQYRFEEYYRRVACPLLMLPEPDDVRNPRTMAAMKGLRALAARARIVEVDGWMHPYGWMVDPGAVCRVILDFLGDAV